MKLTLIPLLLLLLTIQAWAAIGKFVAVRGDITVERDAKALPAKVGFLLEEKDVIKSSEQAKAQILFTTRPSSP